MAPAKKTATTAVKAKTPAKAPAKSVTKATAPKPKAALAPKKPVAVPKKPAALAKPALKAKAEPIKKAAVAAKPALKSIPAASGSAAPAERPKHGPAKIAGPEKAAEPATASAATAASKPADHPAAISGHLGTALHAVKAGQAIELIFTDAEANPPRTFEPRQLIFDTLTQAWYVWGWDRRYNAERHHRIDQMVEVNLVEGPGRSAQGPYKEGTPPNLIGGWLGGEPIPVKVTLLKQWIFAVKQAPPAFPEFKIEDGEDGKAIVSFVATDLRAIARWCLQFGEGIQILEPQRLVDRVKQVGVVWAGKPVAAVPAPALAPKAQSAPRAEHRGERTERSERSEHRPEAKAEPRPEHRSERHREHTKDREDAPKKGPAPKVEIRIERL